MNCPSETALEAHLLAPGHSAIGDHVAACPRCVDQLKQMEAEGAFFQREVFPRTVRALERKYARKKTVLRTAVFALPALAAAALVLFLVRPGAPRDDYLGVKGAALGFSVFASDSAGVRAVDDGASVAATAALRFHIRAATPCSLWLLSVDSAGTVSRLYPSEGDDGAPIRGDATVPGGAVLDGSAGWERLYAICSPQPTPWREVERAATQSAPRAHTERSLEGLPSAALQSSVLVQKHP